MSGLFEHIAAFDEGARIASRKATAVATKRVVDRYASFLANAQSPQDRLARLALVEDEVRQVVADAVAEYAPDSDVESLQEAILDHLKGDGVTDINAELEDAPSAVGSGTISSREAGGHASDCTCGFCANKGKLPGGDSEDEAEEDEGEEKEASARTADADKDGGGAVKREDLPKADDTGLGGPSPEIDKTTWKPNALNDSGNLKPIDTDMDGSPVPTSQQDVTDTPDWEGDFLRDTDSVTEQQSLPSADDSGQSTTRNVTQPSDAADQWTGMDGQADPVSSEVFASVDPDKNPLREILQSGDPTDLQIEAAIEKYESGE